MTDRYISKGWELSNVADAPVAPVGLVLVKVLPVIVRSAMTAPDNVSANNPMQEFRPPNVQFAEPEIVSPEMTCPWP
ncbi:hypothetical protein M3212_07640 [Alkalihalobacillus oceani]|uniref:hypothetical protein n=1 Tax=Halalkalibacter oceani TaxID=1653776 RepID=UPI00203A9A75|nr:hypothetical protein [Halalkalibacter oceani]MCM3760658.1 hypothetical protein [Halalkalibacter oceani]